MPSLNLGTTIAARANTTVTPAQVMALQATVSQTVLQYLAANAPGGETGASFGARRVVDGSHWVDPIIVALAKAGIVEAEFVGQTYDVHGQPVIPNGAALVYFNEHTTMALVQPLFAARATLGF